MHIPKLYNGLIRTDSSGRTFLVDPLKGGKQKHTFLFKYWDGKILLENDKPDQAEAEALPESCVESEAAEDVIPTVIVDEAVEFNPNAFSDEDANATGSM